MDDVDSMPHIPHFAIRTLLEVAVVVGLFGLALFCMACSLNGWEGKDCCKLLKHYWRRNSQDDDDDDEESFIEDNDDNAPAPHIFESLNDLVFFNAPEQQQQQQGLLANEEQGHPISMDKIFPDILGPSEEIDPEANDMTEPLL